MQRRLGFNETLCANMWRAYDILRCDNNVGGVMQCTEHLVWLLFLKFLDQEEKKRTQEAALRGETYPPVLPPDLSWDAWGSDDMCAIPAAMVSGLSLVVLRPMTCTSSKRFDLA